MSLGIHCISRLWDMVCETQGMSAVLEIGKVYAEAMQLTLLYRGGGVCYHYYLIFHLHYFHLYRLFPLDTLTQHQTNVP